MERYNYDKAGETLYKYEHSSGLKAFVIPKRGYSKKYAAFSTHYGSINNEFVIPGETKPTKVPDGIAHFLEHKLFEQKDGNVMDKFSKLGSNPNAYTSFSQTVYLFSCTDKFEENFGLLLDYVQNPYITEESVEKEKGIIGQEIMMYRDNPNWRAFFNLLRSFYSEAPIRIDIAGTVESIAKIDRETLYKCYGTFYHPSNMIIIAVGDLEPEKVFGQVDAAIQKTDARPDIKRIMPREPEAVNRHYAEETLAVSAPIFQMGFRDDLKGKTGTELLKHEVAVKLLLNMLAGRSSEFYERLYADGLINSSFESDFSIEEDYAFSVLGGESPDPLKVKDRFCRMTEETERRGLDREAFERLRRAMMGRYVRQFNRLEDISHSFISTYFKRANLFDYLDVYDKISFEYITEIFKRHFNQDNLALSVIKPA